MIYGLWPHHFHSFPDVLGLILVLEHNTTSKCHLNPMLGGFFVAQSTEPASSRVGRIPAVAMSCCISCASIARRDRTAWLPTCEKVSCSPD